MSTMSPLPPDPYKALGVGKEADTSAIKTAYRKLVLKCHPDKVQDPAQKAIKQDEFQRVQQAYEILGDDSKRREYDHEVTLKKLRDGFHRAMPHHHASTRPPPKNYYEYNVKTAEPPPSFRPGPPPPAAPRSPYPGNPQFSASWEHEMPSHSKPIYDEERKPRRTASHESPRKEEESKDERRRRKEKEADALRREKEKEEREKRRVDRERREREERKEQEKKDRLREERERARRDEERRLKKERDNQRERREKERDELRRRQQDAKSEIKKPAYVEHHEESGEEERRVPKKKTSSENKKHHDSPRRTKSSGRMEAGDDVTAKEKWDSNLRTAAEYMRVSRRKGSGSGPSAPYYPDSGGNNFSENFPNPEGWHAEKPTRSRRPSHDDKKYRSTVEDDPEMVDVSPKGPPPLRKAFTSPVGGMHNMANVSAPRAPNLARANTMQPDLRVPPTAPAAPPHDTVRHSKADRRPRRASMDAEYDDEPVRRSRATRPNVVRYKVDEEDLHPRVHSHSHYRPTEETYYSSPASGGGAKFAKVKVANYDKPMYQAKHYEPEDVSFTPMESPYRTSGGYNNYGFVHAG